MIVLQILMALVSIVLIASVIMQDGDSDGIAALGAGSNNSETFLGKNQTSTLQGKLALVDFALAAIVELHGAERGFAHLERRDDASVQGAWESAGGARFCGKDGGLARGQGALGGL